MPIWVPLSRVQPWVDLGSDGVGGGGGGGGGGAGVLFYEIHFELTVPNIFLKEMFVAIYIQILRG